MRSGAFSDPDHSSVPKDPAESPAEGRADADDPTPNDQRWRVSPGFTALKCAATVALALAAVFLSDDRPALSAAVVATVVAGAYALRDLLAPVRLAADPEGVTVVSGFAGHSRLPWTEIERIRLESRTRAGLRSDFLEIDTGETLHLLSTYDLNARPAEVVETLTKIQAASGTIS